MVSIEEEMITLSVGLDFVIFPVNNPWLPRSCLAYVLVMLIILQGWFPGTIYCTYQKEHCPGDLVL